MSARVWIAVLAFGTVLASTAAASDVGYIYGRVETVAGESYEGQIRWGGEECFWDDMFNSDKVGNDNLDYLSQKDLEHVRARHESGFEELVGLDHPDLSHLFAVRFGDLKRIEVRRGEEAVVEFRNGQEELVKGGSNDIGARITVVDAKRGEQELHWDRIRTIEFENTPAKLAQKLEGEPIYGTVKSGKFDFTGRIQWDQDETLTSDKLDGNVGDGRTLTSEGWSGSKMSVAFGNIATIRKYHNGVKVKMKSGDEVYLTGTNDVNHDNRGIVVIVPKIGSVVIGWDDFDEVTFARAPDTGPSYADYARARDLNGTVTTREGRYDGRIIFDLDEAHDFELLNGRIRDTEYLIPFRDIARIKPDGRLRSDVQLRMGLTIELEDSEDVTKKNDGLLVFQSGSKPKYIDWRDVTEIVFR